MWWACPSYSGCDSEIEFPLDVGCKRQGVKLNFEDIESTTIDLIPYGTTTHRSNTLRNGIGNCNFHTPMLVMPDVIHMVRVVKNARSYTDYGASNSIPSIDSK